MCITKEQMYQPISVGKVATTKNVRRDGNSTELHLLHSLTADKAFLHTGESGAARSNHGKIKTQPDFSPYS